MKLFDLRLLKRNVEKMTDKLLLCDDCRQEFPRSKLQIYYGRVKSLLLCKKCLKRRRKPRKQVSMEAYL